MFNYEFENHDIGILGVAFHKKTTNVFDAGLSYGKEKNYLPNPISIKTNKRRPNSYQIKSILQLTLEFQPNLNPFWTGAGISISVLNMIGPGMVDNSLQMYLEKHDNGR